MANKTGKPNPKTTKGALLDHLQKAVRTEAAPEKDDYFTRYLNRTIMLLGEEAVQTLRTKRVAIAGCGGHGGAAALTLARMGVGNFILADPKPFDEPDINRQWAANNSSLGRNKADVYAEMLADINPEIGIQKFTNGVTPENIDEFLDGADLLIDCLDISVPASLRKAMFIAAQKKGIHTFTAAMLGFGGMVAGAFPSGLPLDVLGGIEDTSIQGSSIPECFQKVFVPDFLALVEKYLPIRRAPSLSVSPALLGVILSVESAVALLGNTIPGWRPPVCLPNIILVDLLRLNFKVVNINDMILDPEQESNEVNADKSVKEDAVSLSVNERATLLSTVGYNTNLLPHKGVELDLLTDSWSEIPFDAQLPNKMEDTWSMASVDQMISGLYNYKYVVPVSRGRFAEALLSKAVSKAGSIVFSNGLFPTTQFHLESNGFVVREILPESSYDMQSDLLFKGNMDLTMLRQALIARLEVGGIFIELCNNAIGGHPVSMAHLTAVSQLAKAHSIPLILDATRAFENAQFIKDREPGFADRSLVSIVRQMCALSDACVASCTKDFKSAGGGFIGMNNEELFIRVSDLTLAFGDNLNHKAKEELAQALSVSPDSMSSSKGRVKHVQKLWDCLQHAGVPVTTPAGGHAIFVDVGAILPHIPADEFPSQVLANELFLAGGIRAAANFTTPELATHNIHLLRLAIPIGTLDDNDIRQIVTAFQEIMSKKDQIVGLRKVGAPAGLMGEYATEFRPLKNQAVPAH